MKTEGKIWVIFDSGKNRKTKPLSLVQAQMMILTIKARELRHFYIWTPGWPEWASLPNFLSSAQKYFVPTQPPEPPSLKELQRDTTQLIKSVASSLKIDKLEETLATTQRYTQVVASEELPKIDYGYYYNEFSGDDLSLSGIPDKPSIEIVVSRSQLGSPRDRRANPRHDFKIEVILLSKKGTSFRTYSRNISMTGTLLEDEIPKDFFHKPFEMILINKFERNPQKNRVHLTGRIIGDLADPKRLMFIDQNEELHQKLHKLINDYSHQQNQLRKSSS
jgi:hypothetical protein